MKIFLKLFENFTINQSNQRNKTLRLDIPEQQSVYMKNETKNSLFFLELNDYY